MGKKDELKKSFKNQIISNNNTINLISSKISLYMLNSKEYINKKIITYSLGISIVMSGLFTLVNVPYNFSSLTTLITSVTMASTLTVVQNYKYKKTMKNCSFKYSKEELIKLYLERAKLKSINEINQNLYCDLNKNQCNYSINKKDIYENDENLLNSIFLQNMKMDQKIDKLGIIISKKEMKNFDFNSFKKYIGTTILSVLGVFSICYLPNIMSNSNEIMLFCLEISLVVNIPINALTIKNIISDKKIINNINNEIKEQEKENNLYLSDKKIDYEYNKVLNEIYASKIQLESDELDVDFKYVENNNDTKQKVLVLKK